MVADDAVEVVNVCKNTTAVACTSCADRQKATIESDFDTVLSDLTGKVYHNSGQIRKILGGFLEFEVYDARQKYSLVSEYADALHGEFDFDD